MSQTGIRLVADVFTMMQRRRSILLGSEDKQDILLGQLLETGKDAMKNRFAEITLMKPMKIKRKMKG